MNLLRLTLDHLIINQTKEWKTFSRIYLALLIMVLAPLIHHLAFGSPQALGAALLFVAEYIILASIVAGLISAALELVLSAALAYSMAFRHARKNGLSVNQWISSEDYKTQGRRLLKISDDS